MHSRYPTFLTLLMLSLVQSILAQPGPDVSREELVATLRSGNIDQIVIELNEIKRMGYKGDILPFVAELWAGKPNEGEDETLPWESIGRDIVRIEFADILAQAHRNGLLAELDEDVAEFARELIGSDDVQLVGRAAQVLGVIDHPRDASLLFELAAREERGTFRPTVLGLASMCNEEADAALSRLQERSLSERNRDFLMETRASMTAFKDRSDYCDR